MRWRAHCRGATLAAARSLGYRSAGADAALRRKEGREHAHVVAALVRSPAAFVGAIQPVTPQPRVLRNDSLVDAAFRPADCADACLAALGSAASDAGGVRCASKRRPASSARKRHCRVATTRHRSAGSMGRAMASSMSRSAPLLRDGQAFLFAGAGIVAGSQPAKEFRETAAKLQPMLAALGLLSDGSDPVGVAGSPA